MNRFTPEPIKSKPVATVIQALNYTDMSHGRGCLAFLHVQNSRHFDMQVKKYCSYQNSTINVTSSSQNIFLMPFPIRLKKWELSKNSIFTPGYKPCWNTCEVVFLHVSLDLLPLLFHQWFPLNVALIKPYKSASSIYKYKVLPLSELPKENTARLLFHK